MIWAATDLKGMAIAATDGDIGTVSDLLFDDLTWRLRWLVADTGNWLPGRLVLLHPSALGTPDGERRAVPVNLTKARVETGPDIQQDLPVSRQMEHGVFAYYGWDPLWGGGAFGMDALAVPMAPSMAGAASVDAAAVEHEGDPHLRSVFATTGHHIHAQDGDIGHAKDFLIDDAGWRLRYMVVDTRNWWPGKQVLLAPSAVTGIDWSDQSIAVNVSREQVSASPEWHPAKAMDAAYETSLRSHYNWPSSGV